MNARPANNSIESIDAQILALMQQRCAAMGNGTADWPATLIRIDQVVESDLSNATANDFPSNPIAKDDRRNLLRHIASVCWRVTRPGRNAFLGPLDSYSHLAALAYFGDAANLTPVTSIGAVFDAVARGDCAGGIVPIENSTDGRVVDTLGRLASDEVSLTGEVLLAIHHQLLAACDRDAITEVHSKPQAISQCRTWLANHLPHAKLVECSSTAAAAQLAASQPGVAAIAGEAAGRRHGLRVVDANIEDNQNNVTRFAVLGHGQPEPTGHDKTTLLFQVDHQPGALADVMGIFQSHQINLTWIESFPLPGTRNEYYFVVEFPGHRDDAPIEAAIAQLKSHTRSTHVLGSYRRGNPQE